MHHVPLLEEKPQETKVNQRRKMLRKVLRRLLITFTIRLIVFSGELIAGLLASSLAIIADALEKLSDMVYLSVSIFSVWVSSRPANENYSFGFYRAGVIGALLSATIMWVISGVLVFSAVNRILNIENEEIDGELMLITSVGGLIINILVMFMLRANDEEEEPEKGKGKKGSAIGVSEEIVSPTTQAIKEDLKKNENMRAVIFDILGDMVQSIITIIASVLVWFVPSAKLADPICTMFFPIICFFVTRPIIKECLRVLMQGAPVDLEIKEIREALEKVEGVADVHDFHIWSLASGKIQVSCHMRANGNSKKVLADATALCESYGIDHTTIQIEEDYAEEELHIGHEH